MSLLQRNLIFLVSSLFVSIQDFSVFPGCPVSVSVDKALELIGPQLLSPRIGLKTCTTTTKILFITYFKFFVSVF